MVRARGFFGPTRKLADSRPVRPALALSILGLCSVLAAPACAAGEREPRPEPLPDKAALFGDPGLVPTRAGERARRELALAGELRASLSALGFRELHVSVTLEPRPRVGVSGRLPQDLADEGRAVEAKIVTLARSLIADLEPADVHLWLREPPRQPEAPPRRLPLLGLGLALLALGISLGVSIERARAAWRRGAPR